MENKDVIENIITYCDGVFDSYPNYSKYLLLNKSIKSFSFFIPVFIFPPYWLEELDMT